MPVINTDLFYATSEEAKNSNWTYCGRDYKKLEKMLNENQEFVWSMGVNDKVFSNTKELNGEEDNTLSVNKKYIDEFNEQILAHAEQHNLFKIIDKLRYRNGSEISFNSVGDSTKPAASLFYATVEEAKNNKWTHCKKFDALKEKIKNDPALVWSIGVGGDITKELDGAKPDTLKANEEYLKLYNAERAKYLYQYQDSEIKDIIKQETYRNGTKVNEVEFAKSQSIIYRMVVDYAPDSNVYITLRGIIHAVDSKHTNYFSPSTELAETLMIALNNKNVIGHNNNVQTLGVFLMKNLPNNLNRPHSTLPHKSPENTYRNI